MSDNPNDNIFVVHNHNIKFINIKTFLTHIPFGSEEYYSYDLREPKRKIVNPDKIRETNKTVVSTTDWSNIPYYPTTREKRENVAKYLIKMGRAVPSELLKQIKEDKNKEIQEDAFNKNIYRDEEDNISIQRPNTSNIPIYQNFSVPQNNNHISKIPIHTNNWTKPPHKYSPQYASYINAKPRAQASARVRLGGVY